MQTHRRIVLAERPRYITPTANCFRLETSPVPDLRDGEVLLKTHWLGMEPYLLGKVKRASGPAPVQLGQTMVGPAVGEVELSRHADYRAGDRVTGLWGWEEHAITQPRYIRKLPSELTRPSHALGALGYSGFGAWLALTDLAAAEPGETVVVGAATGGMGQMVGQIARLRGLRAVGIAGGVEKCRLAEDRFGFDACVDRHSRHFADELRSACGRGVDVYVETLGGKAFDAVLPLMNLRGRMIIAGLMALYAAQGLPDGPDRTMLLLNEINLRRLQVKGLVVFDHMKTRYSEFKREMLGWLASGEVTPLESVFEGLEHAPQALQWVFEGRNLGKTVVHVAA
jgi:NADPH-dependent curcumin reductase